MLDLEGWKNTTKDEFQPGRAILQVGGMDSISLELKIRISCHYYSILIALARLKLNILSPESIQDRVKCEKVLIHSCHSIIELTRHIDVETYTSFGSVCSHYCRV